MNRREITIRRETTSTNRRRFLATVSTVGLSTTLGGCLSGGTPGANGSPRGTSPAEDCEPAGRPRPDAPDAKPYPTYPDSPTEATARAFATGYERAYRHNERLLELQGYYTVDVSVHAPQWAVRESDRGYDVGVNARVQWDPVGRGRGGSTDPGEPTASPLPSGFSVFHAWYRLTDRGAWRGGVGDWELETGDGPDLDGAVPVACADA